MTHGDKKLDLYYGEDEIRRAQNETGSECVEEYPFPFICSLELDSQIKAEYDAIETYDGAFTCRLNQMLLDNTYNIKWL